MPKSQNVSRTKHVTLNLKNSQYLNTPHYILQAT